MIPAKHLAPFTALLTALAEFYPAQKPKIEVISEGYFHGLCVLSWPEMQQLAHRARCTFKFWPTLAELRELGQVEQREIEARRTQRLALQPPNAALLAEAKRQEERAAHEAYLDAMLAARQQEKTVPAVQTDPSPPPAIDLEARRALLRAQVAIVQAQESPSQEVRHG